MEVRLKDVIHHYLGCDCRVNMGGSVFNSILNAELLTNLLYTPEQELHKINEIKPILRPLSDINKEEREFVWKFESGYFSLNTLDSLKVDATITTYLLKQGFDLFGLIESGQAIDKTTLTK